MEQQNAVIAVTSGVIVVAQLCIAALVVRLIFAVFQERVPRFGRALFAVIAALITSGIAVALLLLMMRASRYQMTRQEFATLEMFVPIIALALVALGSGIAYMIVLATTFRRGIGIWVVQTALNAAIVLMVYGGFYIATGTPPSSLQFTQLMR